MTRADLHVHSKYSNQPSTWVLRRIGAPASLTTPQRIYSTARHRGMDFVTITDNDTIAGCDEIAHLPGAFVSAGTTCAFPEDGCKIEILLYGITQEHLSDVQRLRTNIYEVRDYLREKKIVHAVASPLDVLSSRMGTEHFERLLLLFDHFEGLSGARPERSAIFLNTLFEHLTREFMEALEEKWGIRPTSDKPWQKGYVAGSCDYCGDYVGLTYAQCPDCGTYEEFLKHIAGKSAHPEGIAGNTLASAHSMYRVAFQFYQQTFATAHGKPPDLLSQILRRIFRPSPPPRLSFWQKRELLWHSAKRLVGMNQKATPMERRLVREIVRAWRELPRSERRLALVDDNLAEFDRRMFALAGHVAGRVSYRLLSHAIQGMTRGRLLEGLQVFSALLPVELVIAPYFYAFATQNQDRPLLRRLEERFAGSLDLPRSEPRRPRRAWFTDTLVDVNGVSVTIHKMLAVARQQGEELQVISCVPKQKAPQGEGYWNFEPVAEFGIPDYELQKLAMPPILEMLRALEQGEFTEYIISTPGPVGLVALMAAKYFHVPTRGIYHSDFPQHVRMITQDEKLEGLTWRYMEWFYGRCDTVWSPSEAYREQLLEHGFAPQRLFVFNRGTDVDFFNPKQRDEQFWSKWGANGQLKILYVGRVSREKNLDTLLKSFLTQEDVRKRASLAIVGDGPYLEELRKTYKNQEIVFTGFLRGRSLAQAYASADVFVFPSTTDTYGNAVLEAQSSGLPAIVADEGGPKEIIAPGESGFALRGHDVTAWKETLHRMVFDDSLRRQMSTRARERAASRDWETAFREFWQAEVASNDPSK
jgi:glycosyltransferase involved in cell wall biosynthesis